MSRLPIAVALFVTFLSGIVLADPTQGILDAFTRADGAVGSNYTVLAGGVNVSSNTAVPTTGVDAVVWNVTNFGPDAEAYYTITTKPADGAGTLAVGLLRSGTFNGYGATMTPQGGGFDILSLERYDAGAPTTLATTTTIEVQSGDGLEYQLTGTGHALYLRQSGTWTQILTATDSTYTGQTDYRLLMTLAATNGAVDDFGGGTTGGGGGGSTGHRNLPLLGVGFAQLQ